MFFYNLLEMGRNAKNEKSSAKQQLFDLLTNLLKKPMITPNLMLNSKKTTINQHLLLDLQKIKK